MKTGYISLNDRELESLIRADLNAMIEQMSIAQKKDEKKMKKVVDTKKAKH